MLRRGGRQWRFDWQRPRRGSANGGPWMVARCHENGEAGGGALLAPQKRDGIDINPPSGHGCVPPTSRQRGEDSRSLGGSDITAQSY